jgi:hypothetical protein
MFASLILTIPALVAPLWQTPAARDCQLGRFGDPVAEASAVATFTRGVQEYADLHRIFDRGLPLDWMASDPAMGEFAAAELATMLRDARPNARVGDFFKPAVADAFRFRIATTLREHDVDIAALADTGDEEGDVPENLRLAVNRPLPWGVTDATWPAAVKDLPALPRELEYRFIGRALVLLDVRANLVVDVLELAIPAAPARVRERHDRQH